MVGRNALGLLFFLFVCYGAAAIGALFTLSEVTTWYAGLAKPAWAPPNWLFGPVWNVLYGMMAVAGWLAWRRVGPAGAERALALFGVQLVLNAAWSGLFFGRHRPDWAFAEIVVLWAAILATTVALWRVHRRAGLLFVPYLLWVTFAAGLNYAIWSLNP